MQGLQHGKGYQTNQKGMTMQVVFDHGKKISTSTSAFSNGIVWKTKSLTQYVSRRKKFFMSRVFEISKKIERKIRLFFKNLITNYFLNSFKFEQISFATLIFKFSDSQHSIKYVNLLLWVESAKIIHLYFICC